jgi:transcriptional regulator with XRE-family HTH domain
MIGTSELINKFAKLENKNYRHAYMSDHIRVGIASQIKLLRTKTNLTQSDLAKLIGTKQAVISRLEDPDSGAVNLKTLFKIAKAFDVGIVAKFASFGKFLDEAQNVNPADLTVNSFTEERETIQDEYNNNIMKLVANVIYKNVRSLTCELNFKSIKDDSFKTLWNTTSNDFNIDSDLYFIPEQMQSIEALRNNTWRS